MRKGIILLSIGLVMFVLGIFVSTLLSTGWIISGVFMAMIGGALIGSSSHYFVSTRRSIRN